MTMKVYTSQVVVYNSARVLATLFEKEATGYEFVRLDLSSGEHKSPDYLALQPFGKVPAIVDGSLILFETRAIARYLEHKFEGQGTPLYGSSSRDKALVEQWLEVEGQNYNPPIAAIFAEKLVKGETGDKAVMEASVEKLNRVLDVYEAHLGKSKYLAGDFFSLADLAHLPETNLLVFHLGLRDLVEARPHVKVWWEDISSRPAWKKVLAAQIWS